MSKLNSEQKQFIISVAKRVGKELDSRIGEIVQEVLDNTDAPDGIDPDKGNMKAILATQGYAQAILAVMGEEGATQFLTVGDRFFAVGYRGDHHLSMETILSRVVVDKLQSFLDGGPCDCPKCKEKRAAKGESQEAQSEEKEPSINEKLVAEVLAEIEQEGV
ncbi:hypothetical protein NTE19_003394 [Vibrio fluvialis]|nr:hypothetical protein [Vibrio fluvialis]